MVPRGGQDGWRGCRLRRNQLSRGQLRRLLDPDDGYAVLVIGDARNLFADPPRSPGRIRMHSSACGPAKRKRLSPGTARTARLPQTLAHVDAAAAAADADDSIDFGAFISSAGPTGGGGGGLRFRFCCARPTMTSHTGSQQQLPWTLALEPEVADLAHPARPPEPNVTQLPFLESFEGPPLLEHHNLRVGDTAFVVTVRGSGECESSRSWEFWYSGGDDSGFAAACAVFNLLCRQFCRIHRIRKADPSTAHIQDYCYGSLDWCMTLERVRFGSVSGERPGTYHQDHDPERPHRLKPPPHGHCGAGMYSGLSIDDAVREARRLQLEEDERRGKKNKKNRGLLCGCAVCMLRQGAQRHLWAEWRMRSDTGRTTGLKRKEASVVGYHSCVPADQRETLPNVRDDNIDDDKRHAVYW